MGLWSRALDIYGVNDAKAYGRTAWLLTLGTLIMGTSRGAVAPYLVLFLVVEQGIPLSVIGIGIAVEFVVRALVGPLAGGLSDRRGRKPLMLVGLFSTALILPSYLFVKTPLAFMALSVVNGLFAAHSLYGPASSALLMDTIPKERRGGVFGLLHASRNLGWTIGIALGVLLIGNGFGPIFVLGGILPLAYFLVVLLLVREPPRHADVQRPSMFGDWGRLMRTKAFVAYLLLSTTFFLAWGQTNSIFAIFLTEGLALDRRAVVVLAVNSAMIVLLQVPFGRLADRGERAFMLAVAAVLIEATYALYALAIPVGGAAGAYTVVLLAIIVFTFAELLFSPIQSAYGAELAPAGATGSALGILAFAAAVGQAAPALVADAVVPRWGWSVLWLILAATCVPAALGLLALAKRDRTRALP